MRKKKSLDLIQGFSVIERFLHPVLGHVQAFGRASFPVPYTIFGFGPGANRPHHGISAEDYGPNAEYQEKDERNKGERTVENRHTGHEHGLDKHQDLHVDDNANPCENGNAD